MRLFGRTAGVVLLPRSVLAIFAVVAACSTQGAAVASSPGTSQARYLALGDSFTAGTGATPAQSFPARLVGRWSCAVTLKNLGVNGYTTDDLIAEELPQLRGFAPQLVTLAIGANDIVHGTSSAVYREHVHSILAAVTAAGVKRVVAIPQPDWSTSPVAACFGSPETLHASIVDFNAILKDETRAIGGDYVDLFPLMEQQAGAHMVARDGLHPSAAAYDAWASALAEHVVSPCN